MNIEVGLAVGNWRLARNASIIDTHDEDSQFCQWPAAKSHP
ncbi:MAG: hypothetical protein ACM3O8_06895 [Methylococcaceae bacterium]|nr:hypothetical protein [Prolixibacteraceae bacterium]